MSENQTPECCISAKQSSFCTFCISLDLFYIKNKWSRLAKIIHNLELGIVVIKYIILRPQRTIEAL